MVLVPPPPPVFLFFGKKPFFPTRDFGKKKLTQLTPKKNLLKKKRDLRPPKKVTRLTPKKKSEFRSFPQSSYAFLHFGAMAIHADFREHFELFLKESHKIQTDAMLGIWLADKKLWKYEMV